MRHPSKRAKLTREEKQKRKARNERRGRDSALRWRKRNKRVPGKKTND